MSWHHHLFAIHRLRVMTNYLYNVYAAAKVRRLYDIANVFSSMNLIEKVYSI